MLPVALGVTQTIGYGTLYYTLGVTAPAVADDLGAPVERLFLYFSLALLAGAAFAPRFGRLLDRHGARRTMPIGSVGVAVLLLATAFAQSEVQFAAATVAVEIVSCLVLYDAAFAALVQARGEQARRAITQVTLIAGFASTVFWPLTALLVEQVGWRNVYLAYAALNLVVCVPLHALVLPAGVGRGRTVAPKGAPRVRLPGFWPLALSFAATAYVVGAIPAQMVPMLQHAGFGSAAIWLGSLMGPAQVAVRVLEATVMQRLSPWIVAMVAAAAPVLAVLLLLAGAPTLAAGAAFAVLFGFGSGLSSIVRGALPLHLYGAASYGETLGRLAAIRLMAASFAPFLFALAMARLGVDAALWSAAAVGSAALLLLLPLRAIR